MQKTIQVTLTEDLAQSLQSEAEQIGKSVDAVISDWLSQRRTALHRERLAAQTRDFYERHAELCAQYAGKYVAYYDGKVLDHDTDIRALALRVRATHSDLPVVIAEVVDPPRRSYRIISAHSGEPLR